ncbi:cupin domain-containing protein [Pigmentiphaga soli]|uniref:Cupin domain-containing protein n=1 Tax=Pigmentiphaga soli TaxID=1007095 RepID=A0ABP8GZ37_9BURK
MDPHRPTALLGGLSPAEFMRRHWQRKPLLIRQAFAGFRPPLSIAETRRLARRDDVESRLVWREQGRWQMEQGPFGRLPPAREPGWTLLVQGVNLHSDAAADLMQAFRFVPDARLDDVMISIATDGGGVGPHFDSYDVFLLQGVGRRRWRIGRQKNLALRPDAPLKILADFEPSAEYVLEPGDMLYLPPAYAHDGVAEGDCMTISIGFRSPSLAELARGMLETAADGLASPPPALRGHYRDPGQPAVDAPAALPPALVERAVQAAAAVRLDARLASRFLGCWLTEPKPQVFFDPPAGDTPDLAEAWPPAGRLALDRRTQMLYRDKALYINGEEPPVAASRFWKALADRRRLDCRDPLCAELTLQDRGLLAEWLAAGWMHYSAD